jgi:para-nitrobenzyl esterase
MVNTHQRYHARGKSSGFIQKFFLGLLVICAAAAVSAVSAIADSKVVMTDEGPVKGMVVRGVREFLGIPYAAPPVGDRRWQPSQAHAPWLQPLDATKFANHCPQVASPFGVASLNEDCLYLNVFTLRTADDHADREDSSGRTVMVWIHGGALIAGESDDYDPEQLVKKDGVVVVTINYRLGLLGFFAEPALDAEPHLLANYGLMDQQFALQWVRRNIAPFGGDPNRVTIFGESAGGLSGLSNLASPKAAGLFQRAIVESGAYQITSPLPREKRPAAPLRQPWDAPPARSRRSPLVCVRGASRISLASRVPVQFRSWTVRCLPSSWQARSVPGTSTGCL